MWIEAGGWVSGIAYASFEGSTRCAFTVYKNLLEPHLKMHPQPEILTRQVWMGLGNLFLWTRRGKMLF